MPLLISFFFNIPTLYILLILGTSTSKSRLLHSKKNEKLEAFQEDIKKYKGITVSRYSMKKKIINGTIDKSR